MDDKQAQSALPGLVNLDEASIARFTLKLAAPADGRFRMALLMPSPKSGFAPETWRNLPTRVLLMLNSGEIWVMDATGVRWGMALLAKAATALQTMGGLRLTNAQRFLRDELDLPSLQIGTVADGTRSGKDWPVRRVAVATGLAYAFQGGDTPVHPIDSTTLDQLQRSMDRRLTRALDAFFKSASTDALALASAYSGQWGRIYNYLLQGNSPYRLQFAQTCPLLLEHVAVSDVGFHWGRLRAIIDEGHHLNEYLGQMMCVTPAVLKCLAGVPLRTVGSRWLARPDVLFALVEHLRPERRPRSPEDWVIMNQLADLIEARIGRPVHLSFFAFMWLRETLHAGKQARYLSGGLPIDTRSSGLVNALHEDLQEMLAHEMGLFTWSAMVILPRAVQMSLDKWLMRHRIERLTRFGQAVQASMAKSAETMKDMAATARGLRYWPLMPTAFMSPEHSRRIVPLLDQHQLKKHGDMMRICLGNVPDYHLDCQRGRIFIVAIYDECDNPVSTAELRMRPFSGKSGEKVEVWVAQHTGYANSPVSSRCQDAIKALLNHVASDIVQRHLHLGRVAKHSFRDSQMAITDRIKAPFRAAALRAAFGPAAVDALIARCREAIKVVSRQ